MTPAVVVGNVIVKGIAMLPIGTLAGAAAILAPIAIGVALGSLVTALANASKSRREEIAYLVKTDLTKLIENLQIRFGSARLSKESHNILSNEMGKLKLIPASIAASIVSGTTSQSNIEFIGRQLEELDLKITQHEARFLESNKLSSFQENQIAKFFVQLEETYKKDDKLILEMRETHAKINSIPENETEGKLAKLSSLASKLGALLDKAVMEKMLKGLNSKKTGAVSSGPKPPKPVSPTSDDALVDKIARLKKAQLEIEFLFKRLKENDERKALKLEELVSEAMASETLERVLAIKDEIKMVYQKVHEMEFHSDFFREKLKAGLSLLAGDSDLYKKVSKLSVKRNISREDYQDLFVQIEGELTHQMELKKQEIIQRKVREGLSKLDYFVLDPSLENDIASKLNQGEIVVADTNYADYKLLVKLAPDQSLAIRLIRIVANDREKTDLCDFQKEKDHQLFAEWCKNLDIFIENLKENGVLMFEKLRIGEKVDYLTVEQLDQQNIDTSRIRKAGKTRTQRKSTFKA